MNTGGGATAMRVAFKAEFAAAKPGPQKQHRSGCYNRKRNELLPVHARKITSKSRAATDDLLLSSVHPLPHSSKFVLPEPLSGKSNWTLNTEP
jgi:hypothetical protein